MRSRAPLIPRGRANQLSARMGCVINIANHLNYLIGKIRYPMTVSSANVEADTLELKAQGSADAVIFCRFLEDILQISGG